MPALPPNSIFLCYRRADSEVMVDRLYEELTEEFGKNAVFRDIDTIPAGVDFPTYIQQSLRSCAVALICMGPEWAVCPDSRGTPRILDPDDHVRLEIETALALPHVRVIPLLVLRGVMPHADEVPETLRPLRRRNAITVRSAGADYRHDVEHLTRELRRAITDVEAARRAEADKERTAREAARRTEAEKEKSAREAEAKKKQAEREKKSSTNDEGDSPTPKPSLTKEADLPTILLGLVQVIASFFLLWLVVKGISLVPQGWEAAKKLVGIATPTPRPFLPSPSLLNLATPTLRSSPPYNRWNFGAPNATPPALSPLIREALRDLATPTPAPLSSTPRLLSPEERLKLGIPQLGTPRPPTWQDYLRSQRTPAPAATPAPKP